MTAQELSARIWVAMSQEGFSETEIRERTEFILSFLHTDKSRAEFWEVLSKHIKKQGFESEAFNYC